MNQDHKPEPIYRRFLSDKQAADFIRRHGRQMYLSLPFAPAPPPEVVEGLRQSTMSTAQRDRFIRDWGREHFEKLPLL